ncbi:hypothetical protein GS921_25065 [Rhodococcus hoagii]|nr:hypothetical protein [Prescottella equi]
MTDGADLRGHVAGELTDGEILGIFVRSLALRALTAPETLHDDRTAP